MRTLRTDSLYGEEKDELFRMKSRRNEEAAAEKVRVTEGFLMEDREESRGFHERREGREREREREWRGEEEEMKR